MRSLLAAAILLASCSKDPGTGHLSPTPDLSGGSCTAHSDCPPDMWCLNQQCSARPTPETPPGDTEAANLAVTPASLNFGSVNPPSTRTLALILENVGNLMITVQGVAILPVQSPFKVESMGYGPFWIRPGRGRELFVTFAPATTAHVEATLEITSESPARSVILLGN